MKRGKKPGTVGTKRLVPSQEERGHLLGQIEACLTPDGKVNDPEVLASLLRIAKEDGLDVEALILEAKRDLAVESQGLDQQYEQLKRDEAVQSPG